MLAVDYVRRYDPNFTWNIIQELEIQTVRKGERIMTPLLQSSLDEAREEGMKKGRLEGRHERDKEVILNMLKKSADLSFISEVTGLSKKEINKLKNGS